MHVTLICPPNVVPGHFLLSVRPPTPATSVPYLVSSLVHAGHEARAIDALGLALKKIRPLQGTDLYIRGLLAEEIVEMISPTTDVVGISCMFSNEWLYVKRIIQAIRERFPDKTIVVGGEHITADLDYVFKSCPEVSCAVTGEGEEALVGLMDGLKQGKPYPEIPGIAYLDPSGKVTKTTPHGRIRNIDSIPWPCWDDIPLENYFAMESGITSFKGRIMPMLASRGCPYQCTFCSNPSMWGPRWISRDTADVIAEMKFYIKKYRITHFEFHDLTAIVNRNWTLKFTEALIRENLGVTWSLPSGTRSEVMDFEVVDKLYKSGCKKISYAPESGSEATLKRIKKKVNIDKMVQSMKWSIQAGILIRAHIIVGFPDQTLGEVWDSLKFIFRMAWIGVHDVSVYFFVPYPGSELFRSLQASGRIPSTVDAYEKFLADNICNNTEVISYSQHISNRQLKWISFVGMSMFYSCQFLFRPKRFIDTAIRFFQKQPATILDGFLYGLFWSKATQPKSRAS